MALFGIAGVEITDIAFVEFRGLLKAGHATQPQCSADEAKHVVFFATKHSSRSKLWVAMAWLLALFLFQGPGEGWNLV